MTHDKEEFSFALPDDFKNAQRDARGFSGAQMLACEACARANPPTRTNCLYCGATLPSTEASAVLRRPALKPLEEWERGFNVVLLPRPESEPCAAASFEEGLEEASALLRMEAGLLRQMLAANCALPLARAASAEEAELVVERLRALNFKVETLSDETLGVEQRPPRRIRKIELSGEALRGWTIGDSDSFEVRWPEILLLVSGRIFTKRVEVQERRGFKRGASVTGVAGGAGAREMFTDEAMLDIFMSAEGEEGACGWRIASDDFDYSCLGERKSLLARDNFKALVNLLCAGGPQARLDEEYGRVRRLLDATWPVAERTMSGGLKRDLPGRLNREAVTTTTNEVQFTRYARMLYQIELRRVSETAGR